MHFFCSGHFGGCGNGVDDDDDDDDDGHPFAQNIEASSPLNSFSYFFSLSNSCFDPLFHFSCVLYSRWFVKLNDLRTWHQLEIDNNTTIFQPA